MARERSVNRTDVAIDHIIPLTHGGLVHAEWNKQLLHRKCNISKGNLVTASALALAAGRGAEVLDFLAACQHPGPMPRDAVVHLMTPLLRHDGISRSPLARIGYRFRALCGHNFGVDWFPVHGSPPPATCRRCLEHRERLGAGNAPACPGE